MKQEPSIVYFTRDLSEEGLLRAFDRVRGALTGKIAVKLHTGEPDGPNIIPRPWVRGITDFLPDATIVETNTYYDGDRSTTERHRKTIEHNGWTFAPVDILDEDGATELPITGGKWFDSMSVGAHLKNYDSLLALTHFKGHTCGGFGGSDKNLGIGCADGRIGKAMIHTVAGSDDQWGIMKEEFMERMTESAKSVCEYFGKNMAFVNVMRNMSVDCDCAGANAAPVVTPNVGILASLDILAVDKACVDLIYAMKEEDRKAMTERIETRRGLRQLTYMKELSMGNDRYTLIDIDHDDAPITLKKAVEHVVPFVK